MLIGNVDTLGVLPYLDQLQEQIFVFEQDFGITELPLTSGVLHVRGAKQYGKSTWLEQQIKNSITQLGAGTALYISGKEIDNAEQLLETLIALIKLFPRQITHKRIFVDDITLIANWQTAIEKLTAMGELANILVITTGSKKDRHDYIMTHISYPAFYQKCFNTFGADTLYAYILSGGTAIGANCLAKHGRILESIVEDVETWLFKELAPSGKSHAALMAILSAIYRFAPNPVGQSKIARESGLNDNITASSYTKLLTDLMIIAPAYPIPAKNECKYHFTNLFIAMCLHPRKPRSIAELKAIPSATFASVLEWLVAQELWRRACIKNKRFDYLNFWQTSEHEIDFVVPDENLWLEVKSGKEQASNLLWFNKHTSDDQTLTVINQSSFETQRIKGITMEDFLLEKLC